jgi:ribose transport system substrate-binding protein
LRVGPLAYDAATLRTAPCKLRQTSCPDRSSSATWYDILRRHSPKRLYLIPVLSKALDILELLQAARGPMSLEAMYRRANISKTTIYRILKTFVHRGYVGQSEDGLYRLISRPKKARFGFGSQSAEMPFSQAVTNSLKLAASAAGVDLLILDNHYEASSALTNADEFVRKRVDLVIEFQIDQQVAPVIAHKINDAGIPLIAVDIPHPHSTFFGVDNYLVGFEAGKYLAQYAKKTWGGKLRWVLGLDIEEAGPLVRGRITGAFEGIRSMLPEVPESNLVRMDGRGMREKSYRLVLDFLRRNSQDRGVLIAAATDTSALGAVQAVKELKLQKAVAIVGQDCIPEALEEMAAPGSPLIGSVSHEAQSYGPRLIHLALAILGGQRVPPYNYVEHRLVTASSAREVSQV